MLSFFLSCFTGDLPLITAQVHFLRSWRSTKAKRKDVPTVLTKPSVHMFYWQEEATLRELVIPLGSHANYSRATQPLAQRDNKQRTKPPVSSKLTAASGRTGSSRHTASVSHISARFQGSQKNTTSQTRKLRRRLKRGPLKKKVNSWRRGEIPSFQKMSPLMNRSERNKTEPNAQLQNSLHTEATTALFCFYIFVWPAKWDSGYISNFSKIQNS